MHKLIIISTSYAKLIQNPFKEVQKQIEMQKIYLSLSLYIHTYMKLYRTLEMTKIQHIYYNKTCMTFLLVFPAFYMYRSLVCIIRRDIIGLFTISVFLSSYQLIMILVFN